MAENAQELFNAVITARDEASKTLDSIAKRLRGIAGEHENLEHKGTHAFQSLTGHINLLHSRFGALRTSVGETASSFGEFLPVLAGLGAVGSLAGLFELTEHVAEAQAVLSHTAQVIGITTQSLQRLDYAAKMTDTNVESMHGAMTKLNRAIAMGSKNKDAASLFAHLGIATKDASGHLLSAEQLMPKLADAFAHTSSAAMRTRMAMALFGRAGADMIPMLILGRTKMAELMGEAGTVGHVSTDKQVSAGIAYADSMKKATAAVQGFKDTLGDALAPVLQPILDGMTNWVVANRDWIATGIADKVRELGDWARGIDFGKIIQQTTDFIRNSADLLDHVGGLKTAFGALALVMGTEVISKLRETTLVLAEMSKVIWGPVIESMGAFATSLFATRDAAFALDWALDANPFGVLIAGIAIVAAAAYELWNHWDWVKNQFAGLYNWFSAQSGWVQGVIAIAAPFIGLPLLVIEHWKPIKAFFTDLWADIVSAFDWALNKISPIIDKLIHFNDVVQKYTSGWLPSAATNAVSNLGSQFVGVDTMDARNIAQRAPAPVQPLILSPYSTQPDAAPGGPGGPGGVGGAGGEIRGNVEVHFFGLPDGARLRSTATGPLSLSLKQSDGQAFGGVPAYSHG